MKDISKIKNTSGLTILSEGLDGFSGIVYKIEYKNGKPKFSKNPEDILNFIFSWGLGFEHLSVSTSVKCPTWEQMCFMKDIFWNEDEVCMQLHPKKSEYVNTHPFCLHIWRPINEEIPTPSKMLV